MKFNVTNLAENINENIALSSLSKALKELFIKYDNLVDKYKVSILNSNIDIDSDNTSEKILDNANDIDEVKKYLKQIIQVLNAIQTIFEKLNYTNSSSIPNDVNENNFITQLEQFSKQALLLLEDFNREYFQSFYEGVTYLSSLAEIHYNNLFGDLTEEINITDNAEEMLETTEEYLDSLPKINTNELK